MTSYTLHRYFYLLVKIKLQFSEIIRFRHSIFLLRALQRPLRLRGQILQVEGQEKYIFLGSPLVHTLSDVNVLGLSLDDFALHDMVADFLVAVHEKDVTMAAQEKLTRDLAHQRAELALILQSALDAIITLDASGKILAFNPAAERMLGWDQQLMGQHLSARSADIQSSISVGQSFEVEIGSQ